MEVMKYVNIEETLPLREEWNNFALLAGGNLSHSYEWTVAIWKSNKNIEKELFVYKNFGHIVAIFPVYKQVVKKKFISLSSQEIISNIYGPHNTLILDSNKTDMAEILKQHMEATACDIFVVHSVEDNNPIINLLLLGKTNNYWDMELEEHNRSPYLRINKSWEEYIHSKGSKFRWDLKNRQKLIKQKYNMVVKTYNSRENIEEFFDSMYRIEQSSWKEENETSITTNQNQKIFYEVFLPEIAGKGKFLSYVMYFDDVPVAFDMGVIDENRYLLLKTSYDKNHQKIGPGMALREFALESAFQRGLCEYDLLGKDEPWKMKWTDTVRNHSNIYIYNKNNIKSYMYYKCKSIYKKYIDK